jgi:flagella basal body P-ring formation protein FlgA
LIKLALGIGMILASVVGVTALVASMSKTHAMVLAGTDMPVGHTITASDLTQSDGYIVGSGITFAGSWDELVGKVTTRPLAAGEPLSSAVVTDSFDLDLTTLVVSVGDGVPASLAAGDTIEVWSAGTRGVLGSGVDVATPQSGEPRPLAAGAPVLSGSRHSPG